MNSSDYTAHPEEKVVLLMEGLPVAVLGAEDHLFDTAQSKDPFWRELDGKTLKIIYMFNTIKRDPKKKKK